MIYLLWFIVFVVIMVTSFSVGYWTCLSRLFKALDSALEYEHSFKDTQYQKGWFECMDHIVNYFRQKV